MSGIAALYHLDGAPVDRATVERMLAVIPYRGIDGIGVWAAGPVAMGHARLQAVPEASSESGPLVDETGGFVLSMDGRVDNREELAAQLETRGHRALMRTDAELVLRAWQCWGTDAPEKLLGDFAFTLWDKAKRTLFCVRDPLGIKSLYYFEGPRFFLCASELHQLFQDPRVARRPNEPAVADLLVRMPVDRRETLFEGVRRLEPAHYLRVSQSGVECHRYHDLEPSRQIVYRSDDEYAKHFLALFKESVRCRLRSTKGVASDLSGGVDSASIVCMAEKLRHNGESQNAGFESFSVRFETGPAAEADYVEEVLRAYPHRHTYLPPGIATLGELIRQVTHYSDLPDYPNLVCADYAPVLGQRDDLRAGLTGLGGDEWFGATYLVYADLVRRLQIFSLLRRLRIDRNPPGGFAPFPGYANVLLHNGVWPLVPESIKPMLKRWMRPARLPALVTPAFAARTGLAERLSLRHPLPRCGSFARQPLYGCYSSGILAYGLEQNARWTARFRLEGRHPFLDRRIMEFAFAIPDDVRSRGAVAKFVLREAMRGILPERVRIRPDKADLTAVYAMAINALGGERAFERLNVVKQGWVDGEIVREQCRSMVEAFARGDPSYMENICELWTVIAIELWLSIVFLGIAEPLAHVTEGWEKRGAAVV
jgi:asparagine synthase (glutamine-hydrolysing)